MKFEGALIKEQGIEFAIVIVKKHILDNSFKSDEAIDSFQPYFPGIPVILMAQDNRGTPKYYGRTDIIKFMSNIPLEIVPWQEFTVR